MDRPPLDLTPKGSVSQIEFEMATQLIHRSGIVETLTPFVDGDTGRPRYLSLRGFLVACQINALSRHHQAHLVEITRIVNAFTDYQRIRLEIRGWEINESYSRVERLFNKISDILDSGEAGVDGAWFANQLTQASVPSESLMSHSVAVDGTDVETWGALRSEEQVIELDGEATDTQLIENAARKTRRNRAKVLGVGEDGRKQYTADRDARAGHRSATNSRSSGPYIGYELHLAVQARDVRWTNNVDRTTLGPEVPGVITTLNLVPAGTHRGKAIVDHLIGLKDTTQPIRDVVWDPGYSLCQPHTTVHPLAKAEIESTFQIVTHQRGKHPFSGEALLIDGQLFSAHLPKELRDLPVPPRGASEVQKQEYETKFNQRARWRMVRHAGPDNDGVTRWRCPLCAGLLRSRQVPESMRGTRNAPLVELPGVNGRCCSGTLSASPIELALSQRIPFGTTAWRISMGRRQVVESVNAALKGAFVDLARGFFRVFGRTKVLMLLGFTVAAFNLDRIRSFQAKQAKMEATKKPRRKRRQGTWDDLIPTETQDPREPGPDLTG